LLGREELVRLAAVIGWEQTVKILALLALQQLVEAVAEVTKALALMVVQVVAQEAGVGQQSLILEVQEPQIKVFLVETCLALVAEVELVVAVLVVWVLAPDQTVTERLEGPGLQALSPVRLLHELAVVVLAVGKVQPEDRVVLGVAVPEVPEVGRQPKAGNQTPVLGAVAQSPPQPQETAVRELSLFATKRERYN
jgi:hypothetical protein